VDIAIIMNLILFYSTRDFIYRDKGYVRKCDRRYTRMLSML